MTHSGRPPRYEVRATGYPKAGEESMVGWCAELEAAQCFAGAIRLAPDCIATAIFDHATNATVYEWRRTLKMFDPNCLALAEHFLADEPLLRPRVDELAAEIQDAVEDWLAMAKP